MFPIRDDNPTLATPVTTIALIGLNVAAWVLVLAAKKKPMPRFAHRVGESAWVDRQSQLPRAGHAPEVPPSQVRTTHDSAWTSGARKKHGGGGG